MALNSFFLQGSPGEQRLIQELINEQIKIYGVDIVYIPRKYVRKESIIEEISSSKFNDNFSIEVYINNYDGYSGQGDILTKFGVSLKDELNLIVSKQRFEDFISPFVEFDDLSEIEVSSRPREGDLIYFPLGKRLFEVKFVEHEQPFYQLGNLYVYELKCELFEYEDEVINTTIEEVDKQIQNEGNITTLNLSGFGVTATASASIGPGYIKKIFLNNDGSGYKNNPMVIIDPAPDGGINARAVAITTEKGGSHSILDILITNAGRGYTTTPKISIVGDGVGASATCVIEKTNNGVYEIKLLNGGVGYGYSTAPKVTILGNVGVGKSAEAISLVGTAQSITSVFIKNAGIGYTVPPNIIIEDPPGIGGIGNYVYNEVIVGERSGTKARVKSWDFNTKVLKVSFVDKMTTKKFFSGEKIIGSLSGATYSLNIYSDWNSDDKYSQNLKIQEESRLILDFSESNPFGSF